MTHELDQRCDMHPDPFDCVDNLIYYSPRFDEYGIIIHDGGSSFSLIAYCPWCGSKLPESKWDEWFEKLKALGFDDPSEQDIPEEFLTRTWYEET
ncbi:MAG: hypothetical protein H7Z38_17105 [Rubrivivax sp.]|nr:hypothetical protein [Pyrinomonadaceae bacterium]